MEDAKEASLHFTHRIDNEDKENFIVVEAANGYYLNLRVKLDHNMENIRMEMYSKNQYDYTFFFSLTNDSDKFDFKHTYFTVRKSAEEVQELGQDNHMPIIQKDSEITIFLENAFDVEDRRVLEDYTRRMTFGDLQTLQKHPQQGQVHLTFEKVYDNRSNLRFVPLIYQSKSNHAAGHFIVYDTELEQVVRHSSILSALELRNNQRRSVSGLIIYTLTRTSDIYETKPGMFDSSGSSKHPLSQRAKYQITSLVHLAGNGEPEIMHNTMTRILDLEEEQPKNPAQSFTEMSDFLVNFSNYGKNSINLVGRKNLFLSQVAQTHRQSSFEDVFFVPYFTNNGSIKGVRLILQKALPGESALENITIKDQDINNIFHQESELA